MREALAPVVPRQEVGEQMSASRLDKGFDSVEVEDALVSIVVPVYNAGPYLTAAVESVMAQSYGRWELILVDDKSTDDSRARMAQLAEADPRVRPIYLEANSGAAVARNLGIMSAEGKYLAFLDADDLWRPTKLEQQLEFMLRTGSSFTFTGYEFADPTGRSSGKRVRVPARITYPEALRNTVIFTSTVMLDLSRLGKDLVQMPNVRRGQDSATWWKILRTVPEANGLDVGLSLYRRTKGTLSSNKVIALRRTWRLYREVEQLPLHTSVDCFVRYMINATMRRL